MTKLREKDVMAADVMERRGWSIRSLAGDFGVDESTLRYRLKRLRGGAGDGRKRQAEACGELDGVIGAWMEGQAERLDSGRRPEPVKGLYEQLVVDHGYAGSYKSVLRYVRRRQGEPTMRPHRRVEVTMGSQAQVDWVERKVWVEALGGLVKLWAFVMVLSASRMWAVVWSRRKDMASWIRCHNEAFSRLGGVPLTVRPDNEKTAAGRGAGPWGEVNEGYSSYGKQMGFVVNLARPRSPADKGKVERRARDVRWLQVREEDRFVDLESLQATTDTRVEARARKLTCPQTGLSIHDSWQQERLELAPLPQTLPEPFDTQVGRVVGRDCLVSFEGRQYSVPFVHVGRQVQVRGAGDQVQILADHRLVKSYPRSTVVRLLVDQADYEGESTDRVTRPTPLGGLGEQIVLQRSWEAPKRPIEQYAAVLGRLA
jgi:transposase